MQDSHNPTKADLPSTKKLIQSTIIAAATAGVLLLTVVIPAEYGIDPTGIGNIIGLKKMGEIRVSLDREAAADKANNARSNADRTNPIASIPQPSVSNLPAAASPAASSTGVNSQHEMQSTLAPDEGTEIKLVMAKGSKVKYSWSTDGGKANFDIHADSQQLNIDYHQYRKGSDSRDEGIIEAAFDGSHGWFLRNRNSTPIVITLKTQGQYTEIKRVK